MSPSISNVTSTFYPFQLPNRSASRKTNYAAMASLDLSQDELKAIESTRGRLFQLTNSIGSLKTDLYKSNPLPSA